ncbi:LytTR family DNA-binding domain-containing protein [Christensenellaceae bacterium OttesenSCG-928-K19]|nr:LytTR family DNA-binding domain-containing protein [Christensenellaceae bacterium OttesenSCG-928-K19]
MNIAVCEDYAPDRILLCGTIENYFSRMGYAGELCCFETGEELLAAFSSGSFDIVFLDIFLPGISGVDVARKIREADPDCILLFTTVSLDHALDGFEVQASGYVVKPIDQEKMDKALYMCREVLSKNGRTIEIPSGRDGSLSLPLGNILYIEVYGKFSLFHMQGGVFEARQPLDEIEQRLGGIPFLRCHRSYIVNMNYVDEIDAESFVMKNGDLVPMRKNGRREVKITFSRFLARQALEVEKI